MRLFLIFGLFWSAFAQAQTFRVELQPKPFGYFPDFHNTAVLPTEQASLYSKGLPTGFSRSALLGTSLQKYVAYYQSLHAQKITPVLYGKLLENLGVDSLDLPRTRLAYPHKVAIWTGIKGSKKHIRIDSNQDFSFLDEHEMVYDTLQDRYKKPYDSLPTQTVQYQYFDGKNFLPRRTQLKIKPLHAYDDVLDIYVAIHENLAGTFEHRGKTYEIALENYCIGVDDIFPNSRFQLSAGKETGSAKIGEVLVFGGFYWRVEAGKDLSLYVHCLGEVGKTRLEGVHKDCFLPAYNFETMYGQTLPLPVKEKAHTLLYFWSTKSMRFVEQTDFIKTMQAKHLDIAFVGIAYDEDQAEVKSFAYQKGLKHPHIFESMAGESEISWKNVFEIKRFPTCLLIDKTGKIQARTQGGMAFREMENLYLSLKEGKK